MSVNVFSEFPLAADFQTSVRDNRVKPQSTVKTVILYEEQNIALRNHRHDATRLNTGKTHGDVVLETHLATHNNAENISTERNYFHHRGADPATVHRGADPATVHRGADPTTVHRGADPATVHRGADPATVHRGAHPATVHRGADPVTVHRGADPATVHRGADPAKIMSNM